MNFGDVYKLVTPDYPYIVKVKQPSHFEHLCNNQIFFIVTNKSYPVLYSVQRNEFKNYSLNDLVQRTQQPAQRADRKINIPKQQKLVTPGTKVPIGGTQTTARGKGPEMILRQLCEHQSN